MWKTKLPHILVNNNTSVIRNLFLFSSVFLFCYTFLLNDFRAVRFCPSGKVTIFSSFLIWVYVSWHLPCHLSHSQLFRGACPKNPFGNWLSRLEADVAFWVKPSNLYKEKTDLTPKPLFITTSHKVIILHDLRNILHTIFRQHRMLSRSSNTVHD